MPPVKQATSSVDAWLAAHPGWSSDGEALRRALLFPDLPSSVAFCVRLAFVAERRDHHPDLLISGGRVEVRWTTHDVSGISDLDLALAEETDRLAPP
jgi:4a-hydroxytetrahydrobiopterin dehydratase